MPSDSSQNAPSFPGRRDILHRSAQPGSNRTAPTAQTPALPRPGPPANDPRAPLTEPPPIAWRATGDVHLSRPPTYAANLSRAAGPSTTTNPTPSGSGYAQHPVSQVSWARHHTPSTEVRNSYGHVPAVAGPSNPVYARTNTIGSASPPNAEAAAPSSRLRTYVGIREVPGEGSFHTYDDGYRIPILIEGEKVNPAWGLTKANKPRKRLALACISCRSKKIKCDPGIEGCLQCEKANIPCKRGSKRFGLIDDEPPDPE